VTPAIAHWPGWLHALFAVLFCLGAIVVWRLCFWLAESPAVIHFLHSFDPLCWRCFRDPPAARGEEAPRADGARAAREGRGAPWPVS
jgi:hypothetical protein